MFSIGEERKQIGIYFVIYVNDCKTSNRICCLFRFQYLHRGILSAKGYLVGVDSESWICDIIRNDVHVSAKSLKTLLSSVPLSVTSFYWKKRNLISATKVCFIELKGIVVWDSTSIWKMNSFLLNISTHSKLTHKFSE